MSGGVDSSVAAALLVEAGYNVIGVSMCIWDDDYQVPEETPSGHACFGPGEAEDVADARQVARQLDIPFHLIDLREQYQDIVLDYFKSEYSKGRTPNPCIRCNYHLKFDAILNELDRREIAWDYYATGHYVRRKKSDGLFRLLRGIDPAKDQSYFLYTLDQERLRRTLFPLGELEKSEVRQRAAELGLDLSDKEESQDFYAGDYTELLDDVSGPGPIVDSSGKVLGEHRGIENYTIGQRRGLGLATGTPLYVKSIDAEKNQIVVAEKSELFSSNLTVEELNWITPSEPIPEKVQVKIRYRHSAAPARLQRKDSKVEVKFTEPQLSVTPGQAAVFYSGDVVLGGGIIQK